MQQVIDRLKAATAPSRELDIVIAQANPIEGWRVDDSGHVECYADMGGGDGPGWFASGQEVPEYTASLDAAMKLIDPKAMRIMHMEGSWEPAHPEVWAAWTVTWYPVGVEPDGKSYHAAIEGGPTPAMALCVAALEARRRMSLQPVT